MRVATTVLALGVALLTCPVTAQNTSAVSNYVQERDGGPRELEMTAADAASRFNSPSAPLILDLRPGTSTARLRVKGARRLDFNELFRPETLNQLGRDQTMLVLDENSSSAVETVVLLRMLGYSAFYASGGLPAIAQELSKKTGPGTTKTPVGQFLEGTDLDSGSGFLQTARGGTGSPNAVPAWAMASIGALALAVLGLVLWFLVIQPRQKARLVAQAAEILKSDNDEAWGRAETLLNEAIGRGLSRKLQYEGNFLLAYVKTRLGRFDEAALVLRQFVPVKDTSLESLYLDFWLRVKQKNWEEAERRWYEHGGVLKGFLESNEMAGQVFLEMGRQSLTRKEYDKAVAYFQKVRELGVLLDLIPGHAADLEMVLGMGALFEDETRDRARTRFEAARVAAEKEQRSSLPARIGLLLCTWKDQAHPDIDEEMGSILEEILRVGQTKRTDPESEHKPNESEFLPHMALWHSISLLYQWMKLPEKKGLPAEARSRLNPRLDLVRKEMPDEGDADLVEGLLDYYLALDEKSRRKAVEMLTKASKAKEAVTLPELLYLLECEQRLTDLNKDRVASYFRLLKSIANDPSVPLARELVEHVQKNQRFRNLGEIHTEPDEASVAPSLLDLAGSSKMIEERVKRIMAGHENEAGQKNVSALLERLDTERADLDKTVAGLGKTELELMIRVGETILPEEPGEEEAVGEKARKKVGT